MTNKLLQKKDVAQMFNVTDRTVENWSKKGLLKPETHLNGRPRYSQESIALMIQKGKK